jgi:hypothetical protein
MSKTAIFKGGRRAVGEDYIQTPESSILPIRKYIPDNVKTIWEPTAGGGAISKHLKEWGYTVVETDLYPKKDNPVPELDFLKGEPPAGIDMVIFNPPFSLKTEFLRRVCELGLPFMFICPITIMESEKRVTLFRDHHLSVLNLPKRTNYINSKNEGLGGTAFFHSVWVCNLPDYQDRILYV